ncbi:MAG TPA: alpha-amylase family glycosyl hydrolase [Kiritimatiellia bacterium]|nr:alpha-amylase family glycosyl hydrolase [Kiritimatiellia bacterium]
MKRNRKWFVAVVAVVLMAAGALPASAEVILQYFNTSWNEIAERMPELAEAGYTALWLPPPFKAGGQLSVGFDTFDRFDIGTKDQMGGVPTRYGTGDDLKNMVETAHRFGIRVYFDNVMAHNGGPIPGYDENTPITCQPGFVPEDFHLMVRSDGTFRKMPDWPNWNDEWQVQHRNPFGLDIAQETPVNESFGPYEGAQFPKYWGVRHPDNPEYYYDTDLPIATNWANEAVYTFANKEPYQDTNSNGRFDWTDTNGNGQHDVGEASEPFTDTGIDPSVSWRRTAQWGYGNGKYDMGNPVAEDVNTMLFRAIRWFIDQSKCDGFRLDAVKHVPSYFFGDTGASKDFLNWGYTGQIQEQFNVTHGYSDWNNHRDTCFGDQSPRDDALLYGEHLSPPPGYDGYANAGMRIAHDGVVNGIKDNVGSNLSGMDQPGWGSYGVDAGMMYVMSHDNNYLWDGHYSSAHALILTRAGIPIVYTDGMRHAGAPDWFPKPSYVPFLGQWHTYYMLNLLNINRNFARGWQKARWGNQDLLAYERIDGADTAGNCILLFALARGWTSGQSMEAFYTSFPEGAYLYNYSFYGGGFYARVNGGKVRNKDDYSPIIVPSGGYFAFSWRSPEESTLWSAGGGKPVTIYENGRECDMVGVVRKDGPNGDADFNPYNVADSNASDYSYTYLVPRVTVATNLRFVARVDGSAANVLMKLDSGVDLDGDGRDNPPALSTDVYLGYEQADFVQRQYPEKFAAVDSGRDKIGSPGAETYVAVIGTGLTTNQSDGVNDWNSTYTASWVYHNPNDTNNIAGQPAQRHLTPLPQNAVNSNITVWVKVGHSGQFTRVHFYYTTDGQTWPEGAGGGGIKTTQVKEMTLGGADAADGTVQWWTTTLPAMTNGAILRYKIGTSKRQGENGVGWDVAFPNSWNDITRKTSMMGEWRVTNFNAATAPYFPNADYGVMSTGLVEGTHVLSVRAFLGRSDGAAIYNTFVQTFYLDAATPSGAIIYPASDGDTLYGSRYGLVVRGDRTVKEAWYRITDTETNNDDSATGASYGNGAWVKAVQVSANPWTKTPYPNEWRFDYVNIPASNSATIEVRLCEITSSTNMSLGDAAGHFTTLTRTVNTRGPDVRMYIAWPPVDGQVVGAGYGLKAYFSKALADGISSNDLINCFTLSIDSNVQARSSYNIVYNETWDYHALAFAIPNLYDGVPDHQHTIEVLFNRDPYPELAAYRRILAQPVDTPYMDFVTPPILDDQQNPFYITFPDVAAPTTNDRQYTVQVEVASTAQDVNVYFTIGTGTLAEVAGNPATNGNLKTWDFLWSFPLTNNAADIEGTFQLRADADVDGNTNTVEAYVLRDVRVILRETVNSNTNDADDDDDGLSDYNEATPRELPSTDFSTWNNGDVHVWYIYGKTKPQSPDSDGDGLPDGLECGWRNADTNQTDTAVDTDGDGFKNFIGDLDPPFYNTADNYGKVPGVSAPDQGSKTDLKAGSTTDPNNPDSDYDGLPDGVEDANRNGWVDGDGAIIQPDWEPWLERDWPDRSLDASDTWTETDPNNADTDDDDLSDGWGEDKDFNGRIAGDTNSNRVYDAGEEWAETDPLNRDTDGDGLPDGWEVSYNLDPLDNGSNSLRTATAGDGSVTNGAAGDPDEDGISNLSELISGTNPRWPDSGEPPPQGQIIIGTGTPVTVGAVLNRNEFTDWTYRDLIALDPYDVLEQSSGGDVYYRPWASDGLESSRDLVAFYAHDGGSISNGGDGTFCFRVDMHNLQARAEDSGLDIYVVIDTGNKAVGERKLVDGVDCLTDMRWEVTVAVYDGNNGTVYVNKPGSWDTTTLADDIVISPDDVEARTKAHANGFKKAYFNSDLDSVEFSISRQALIDAGWNGNPASLSYQVFTTRDGTVDGPGELDGPDIQDSIRTDWIAEDFAGIEKGDVDRLRYEGRIALTTLSQWVGINADNDRGKRIKIISLVHGNQHNQPGRVIQNYVNTGAGGGYYRPLDVHQAYGVPVTMHITPTLASALQWARVDTNVSPAWRDGPALNRRIGDLAATGVVDLVASTFSDHMLPYFTKEFNSNNVALADEFLASIYGAGSVSRKVFWTPERLVDADVLSKITALGFSYTFIDQVQHLRQWFGYNSSVGEDAYRVNRINGVKCVAISGRANEFRFSTEDNGPAMQFREILNRRARTGYWSGQHPQVLTLFYNWEDFTDLGQANAYDKIIRWLASRGWVELVTPDAIADQEIDISLPPDATGDAWNEVDRGTGLTLEKVSHDWVQYSSQDNYDNWYMGSGLNQGLNGHRFQIRPGTNLPSDYGMLYYGGIVSTAWDRVVSLPGGGLSKLAQAVMYASVFETAYHNQSQNPVNMSKFAIGDFAYPDTSYDTLADFSRIAQSQTRMAAVYQRVDQWESIAAQLTNTQTAAEDVDLDGENEYLLYNDRLFGLFERSGGRLIAVWVRDILGGEVFQASGNLAAYAGSDNEEEGATNILANGSIGSFRTSCLKDWWAGTTKYVNDLYAFSDRTNGWRATSSDGAIVKLVTLAPKSWKFNVSYTVGGVLAGQTLYIRNGFSPNLYDLLLNGQQTLGGEVNDGAQVRVVNTNYSTTVEAFAGYHDLGNTAAFNAVARDDGNGYTNYSLRMRNQAQTHQVELFGTNSFSFSLGFRATPSDWDGDGMPNTYEDVQGFGALSNADGAADADLDLVPNAHEYIAGTDPKNINDFLSATVANPSPTGIVVRFATKQNRDYFISYQNTSLLSQSWSVANSNAILGTGGTVQWLDDGALTDPDPSQVTNRFYRVRVQLPQ